MSDTAYNPPEESMDSKDYLSNQQAGSGETQVVRDRDTDAGTGAVKRSVADSDRQLGMDYFYLRLHRPPPVLSLFFSFLAVRTPIPLGTVERNRKLT